MVHSCVAFNCTSASDKNPDVIFHGFPFKNKSMLDQWIRVVRRKNWKPTSASKLCSLHFHVSDYKDSAYGPSRCLKSDAVPSLFNYPNHLLPKLSPNIVLNRDSVQPKIITEEAPRDVLDSEKPKMKDVSVQTDLTNEKLTKILTDLRRDKKILQQRLQRRENHITTVTEMKIQEAERSCITSS